MATKEDFGELLIEALEEAVAYKQGKRPEFRITRYEVHKGGDYTIIRMTVGDQGRAS